MAVYSITYDLNKETSSKDYNGLYRVIKSFTAWARICDSSYVVETSMTPDQMYDAFAPYLDDNDYLMIFSVARPYSGRNTTDVIEWLRQRM